MKVINGIDNYTKNKQCLLTIGTFDGIHIGHQKIINELVFEAHKENLLAVVLSFFPHPRMVLQKDNAIKLIDTIEEKKDILEKMGVDVLVIHPFSKSFSKLSAIEFTRDLLVDIFKIKKIFIGFDHRFGRNRKATVDDLIKFGSTYNFSVKKIEAQEIKKVNISSTKIRKALAEGDLKIVNQYLARPFVITGIVIKGKEIGRKINFPTANIHIEETYKILPINGVYFVYSRLNNEIFYGMMNIGNRPTINGKNKTIEIHFFNFNYDIYGNKIKIKIYDKIRDEIKFNSLIELQKQLEKDKITCIELRKNNFLEI